jgi:hypothetical protein
MKVSPICGADIHDCIAEAIFLSVTYHVVVEFTHNTIKYVIDGVQIVNKIYENKKQ